MSEPVLSREYLLSRPVAIVREQKTRFVDRLYARCAQEVLHDANRGKKSYFFQPMLEPVLAALTEEQRQAEYVIRADYNPNIYLTKEELIEAFQEKFPDCSVFYQETWVRVGAGHATRHLKRGFMIDWS